MIRYAAALVVCLLLAPAAFAADRALVIGIGKDHVAEFAKSHGTGTWLSEGNVLMAGTACFVLPYLVLAAPAGYLADKYSKRQVIVACKFAEIIIMVLGVGAILLGNLPPAAALALLFIVLALMGAQAALFSPARSGSASGRARCRPHDRNGPRRNRRPAAVPSRSSAATSDRTASAA